MKTYSQLFLLLIGFVLLADIRASAQTNWFFTGLGSSGVLYYIDKDFTRKPNGITQVWSKAILANENFSVDLKEWNCSKKTFRVIKTVLYDPKGKIIESSDKPTEWRQVVPDSTGMLMYINICEVDKNGKLTTDKYDGITEKTDLQFYSFAQITAEDVKLMSEADCDSKPIRNLAPGERLALISEEPKGIWIKVYDPRTGEQGWLNIFFMKIISPGKRAVSKKPIEKTEKANRKVNQKTRAKRKP